MSREAARRMTTRLVDSVTATATYSSRLAADRAAHGMTGSVWRGQKLVQIRARHIRAEQSCSRSLPGLTAPRHGGEPHPSIPPAAQPPRPCLCNACGMRVPSPEAWHLCGAQVSPGDALTPCSGCGLKGSINARLQGVPYCAECTVRMLSGLILRDVAPPTWNEAAWGTTDAHATFNPNASPFVPSGASKPLATPLASRHPRAQVGSVMTVPVGRIRFTHGSIAPRFNHGEHRHMSIEDTVQELIANPSLANRLGLQAAQYHGNDPSYTGEPVYILNSGNRRLHCLKRARIHYVLVRIVDLDRINPRAFTSETAGLYAPVRTDARNVYPAGDKDGYLRSLTQWMLCNPGLS